MSNLYTYHAKLALASISHSRASACGARWTLKQVQGDDDGEATLS